MSTAMPWGPAPEEPPHAPGGSAPDREPGPTPSPGATWHRQDPRMMLVHPVKLLGQLLPLLVVLLFTNAGNAIGQVVSGVVAAMLAVVVTLVQFLTFRYRIGPETVEIRQGWLVRSARTIRLERVRTVDLEGDVLQRALGLREVTLGTGVDDERVEIEGIPTARAEALREGLLRRVRDARVQAGETVGGPDGATAPSRSGQPDALTGAGATTDGWNDATSRELARWNPRWLRFGPLGGSGLIVGAAALGALSQVGDDLAESDLGQAAGGRVLDAVHELGLPAFVAVALGVAGLGAVLFSTLAYLLQWWGLRVERTGHGTLQVRRGLATTRANSMEERRVRGVLVVEPWQQRWLRGASLSALVTGAEGGTVQVLPTVPRAEALRVGVQVLDSGEDRATPVDLFDRELVGHGPRALRRMVNGALIATVLWGVLPAALGAGMLWALDVVDVARPDVWPLLVAWAVLVALVNLGLVVPAWRALGHGVTQHHVYFRSGALLRRHVVLEKDGILGWTMRESLFQRRLGLCTVTATLAGGGEAHDLPNVPVGAAVAMMHAATPGLVGQFARRVA